MPEQENLKKYMLLGSELPITLKKCTEHEILLLVLSLPPIGFIIIDGRYYFFLVYIYYRLF